MESLDHSPMFRPLVDMSRLRRWKMIAVATVGGALEFYDFVIFAFLSDVIGMLFLPPGLPSWLVTVQTFGIFAAGYIFRPLGGVVLAHFGDHLGRKHVFAFSVLLMAAATLAIGFLPVYHTIGIAAPLLLIAMRMVQGIAIGGEIPGAWTFVAEHVPSKHVGLACGLVCMGLNLGALLGSVIATSVTLVLSPADVLNYGWRFPFLIAGVFGLVAVYLRRMLHETPAFTALKADRILVPAFPLRAVLKKYSRGIVTSMLGTWILSAVIVTLTLMTPAILEEVYHYGRKEALMATNITTASLAIGVVWAGAMLDRIAAPKFFVVGGFVLALGICIFYVMLRTGGAHLYLLSAIAGLSGGVVAGVPVVMVSCFPTSVRFTGISFSYNVSYAFFGSITPIGLLGFQQSNSNSHIYYLLFISSLSVAFGTFLFLSPKTVEHRRD